MDNLEENIQIQDDSQLTDQNIPKISGKLDVYDWLKNITVPGKQYEIAEIRFKNTRKGYFRNVNHLRLTPGDIVAVEASPGHDIGIVSLTGELVREQLMKYRIPPDTEFKKIYRKAKATDIEKWIEAIGMENETMLMSRSLASSLKLSMKIGDVEYQGDKTKAIFYYIADERVDFRELIKVLAEKFKIRIEMRQIGARQEAGRIGGIGSCGRQLCCSTWISNFCSVTTNAARLQELSLNPQKLAGQCGKLKCCLNYELPVYVDARKDFPEISSPLITKKGRAYLQKTDVFRRIMWFSYQQSEESSSTIIPIPVEKVNEIISLNRQGIENIDIENLILPDKKPTDLDFTINTNNDSLTRFDKRPKKNKKSKGNYNQKPKLNKPENHE